MSTERITSGGERAVIENMLDRNRAALIETARGLSEGDARRRLVPSLTTPISLIKHAAAAERIWFQRFWRVSAKLNAMDTRIEMRAPSPSQMTSPWPT